jgi:hypothetical protein
MYDKHLAPGTSTPPFINSAVVVQSNALLCPSNDFVGLEDVVVAARGNPMTDLNDQNSIQVSITARIYHRPHEVFTPSGKPSPNIERSLYILEKYLTSRNQPP